MKERSFEEFESYFKRVVFDVRRMKNIKNLTDVMLATELGLSKAAYSDRKKRGRVPFEGVVRFCARHYLDPMVILYDKRA